MFRAWIRVLFIFEFDDQGLEGVGMSWRGMAASWKMAAILEMWLGDVVERVRVLEGARFRLLFGRGMRWGVSGDVML